MIFNIVWSDIDSTILNNIMFIFLLNYIDQYSDLNPSNSKHILDALHDLINKLNIHNLFSSEGGGGNSDPYFFPLNINEEDEEFYSYLVIKTNEKSDITISNNRDYVLDDNKAKVVSEKVDEHNKGLI